MSLFRNMVDGCYAPLIPQSIQSIYSTNLVARWTLDGTLTDQVAALALTRSGTWNTSSYNMRWDTDLNQYVPTFSGTNYYTFTPTGFPSGASSGSMTCWAKFRTKDVVGSFAYGTASGNTGDSRITLHTAGLLYFAGQNVCTTSSGMSLLGDGAWHNIASTYNGSTLLLYVDGILQGSSTGTLATVLTVGTIGNNVTNQATYQMTGYMADCRCYSSVLTSAQVLAIAKCTA